MTWFLSRFAIAACAIALMVGWAVPKLVAQPAQLPPPGDGLPDTTTPADTPTRELEAGHTIHYWHLLAARRARRVSALKRVLLHTPTVTEAIALAALIYRQSYWSMIRRASCESHLYPGARNTSSASGLFQILYPSTWRTTPYANFSPFSPYANALAAGYMLAHGRAGEWVCGG